MASTDWKEKIPAGEAEKLEALATVLHGLQVRRAAGKPADRALHAKANAGLSAALRVSESVPERLRVGIFAKPGTTYRAYVRYSNGSGTRGHDKKEDVRGIAVKLLGVPGKKIISGMEGATTHDLLLIRSPSTPTRTAAEFVALVEAAERPALLPIRLAAKLGPVRAFQILAAALPGLRAPQLPLASTTFFSALPITWGAHAVKLTLSPHESAPAVLPKRSSSNALGDELAARLATGPLTYDLSVQLFVDETTTPIEDPSVTWTNAASPLHKVAELVIDSQDPSSERGKKLTAYVETLSFDPWHAPEEFRPIGELMRARNAAYRLSTKERKAAGEPDGSERFD
jgi:hypothetical protein